jgi:Ca2+-binding RTX toxin-like protein
MTTGRAFCAAMLTAGLFVVASPRIVAATPLDCFGRTATIVGTDGPDRLIGTPRNDVIVGGSGADSILGRGGNDMICGGTGPDTVHGGRGSDNLLGQGGDDALDGGRSTDVIAGGSNSDTITGREGTDLLNGEGGDDSLKGGRGFDLIAYFGARRGVNVDLDAGAATGHGTDRITGVEGVEGSIFDDTLAGDGRRTVLFGDAGNDTILGRDEKGSSLLAGDFLDGGPGNDDIDGGAGFDSVSFQNAGQPIVADLSAGTSSGQGTDTLTNVEGLFGNGQPDSLSGDDGNNALWGQRGDDTLDGRGGVDVVGFATFFGRPGPVVANLVTGNATGVGNDTLLDIENLQGTARSDTFIGNDAANELVGWGGNDSISGAGGDDTLRGGAGDDRLDGGEGTDDCFTGEIELNCEGTDLAPYKRGLPSRYIWEVYSRSVRILRRSGGQGVRW